MSNDDKYGILLNSDAKLFRNYFEEMCELIGIKVLYYPTRNASFTKYTEIITSDCKPIVVGCIFAEHPDQQTLKKIGWASELSDNAAMIHVPYDLPNLQQGSLFVIPSGIDNAEGRLFRVSKMTNKIIYPSTIICELVPEYNDNYSITQNDFKHNSFNLLAEEDIQ